MEIPESDIHMTFWRPQDILWMSQMSWKGQILTKLGHCWLALPGCPGDVSEWYIMPNLTSLDVPLTSKLTSDSDIHRTEKWPKPDVLRTPQGRQIVSWAPAEKCSRPPAPNDYGCRRIHCYVTDILPWCPKDVIGMSRHVPKRALKYDTVLASLGHQKVYLTWETLYGNMGISSAKRW